MTYNRNEEGWRPYNNQDQEKVDLINDTLGPGARNVACDLDRVQYDNVHKRLVFLEIETESQRDPWDGGSIFGGPDPSWKRRTYAYIQKWNIVCRTGGSLIIIHAPSKRKRDDPTNPWRDHWRIIEVLAMDFDQLIKPNVDDMTKKQVKIWWEDLNSRCINRRENFIAGEIGISFRQQFRSEPYKGAPNAHKQKNPGTNPIPDQRGHRQRPQQPGRQLPTTPGILPGMGHVLDAPNRTRPPIQQPGRMAENAQSDPWKHARHNPGDGTEIEELPF